MGKARGALAVLVIGMVSPCAFAADKKTEQMKALDNALQTGVLTKEEYEAKKAALLASTPPAASSSETVSTQAKQQKPAADGANSGQANYYRLKQVKVVDQHGFEKPIPAMSLLIPTDWQFQGNIKYLNGSCGLAQTTFRASGPDGRSIELLPEYNWVWSDDAFTIQALQAQRGCDVMRPMSAADLLRRVVVPKVRPGARLVAVESIPKIAKQMQEIARRNEAMSAQAGLRASVRSDVGRARLQYTLNGQSVEGWVTAVTLTTAIPSPTLNMQTMQQGHANYYTSWAQMFDLRTPSGQLDASQKFFEMIASTIRVDPDWQARVSAVQNNIAAANIKGAADRSRIISKSNAEISNTITKGYEERSKSRDRAMQKYDQALRGVETYRNPNTGETFELSNEYGHAWINGNNEYILSDREGFNPNVELRQGNWTQLERVKQ